MKRCATGGTSRFGTESDSESAAGCSRWLLVSSSAREDRREGGSRYAALEVVHVLCHLLMLLLEFTGVHRCMLRCLLTIG